MTKLGLITQSHTKRVTAAAIANAKARNGWSNSDAADALGTCEGTVRNRLDADCPKNQMTVHELLRSLPHDIGIANDVLAPAGHKVVPLDGTKAPDMSLPCIVARFQLELSLALEDGRLDPEELRRMRPQIEALGEAVDGLRERMKPRAVEA
jgi:hypothetical protein